MASQQTEKVMKNETKLVEFIKTCLNEFQLQYSHIHKIHKNIHI